MKLSKSDSTLLGKTWEGFLWGILAKDRNVIETMSLKKVYCYSFGNVLPNLKQQQLLPIDIFIDSILSKFYNNRILGAIRDSSHKTRVTKYSDRKVSNLNLKNGQKLILYDIYYKDYVPFDNGIKAINFYFFSFVKINNEFKFFQLQLESPR
jgi:hypothetical protein